MGKSILVTGCNGLVGQQVVKGLLDKGHKITGIGIGNFDGLQAENFKYIAADLTQEPDISEMFKGNNFSHVIHLAAIAHSIKGINISWSRYYRVNTMMSRRIFEFASRNRIPIFFASTVDVYGIQNQEINEETTPNPIGFYGKSKALAEKALMETAPQPYLIARFAPIYSASNKKDIYRRYYIKHPKIAYLINKGMNYEFLSLDLAGSVITQWVDNYESMRGILNVVDTISHNTKAMLEKDIGNGVKPIVMTIPNFLYKLMVLVVNILFCKLPFYKFSAYKILKPMRFDKGKILKSLHCDS